MIEKIKNTILKEFGLNLVLEPFGENKARNNVFIGVYGNDSFIVKIEELKQLQQVKISTQIASHLNSYSIDSSRYLKTNNGDLFSVVDNKVVTIQVKEELTKLSLASNKDFIKLGTNVAEFHTALLNINLKDLSISDFYQDFMCGEIPLAQTQERLNEIKGFYDKYNPSYKKLTMGIIHNDLNTNNLLLLGDKYFFIDFEFAKKGPLISDLGVLILELWNNKKGVEDYKFKLRYLLKGYEQKIKLTEYDKSNIIIYSLRYLFSDENWYTYWSLKGNPNVEGLIPEVKEKQKILLELLE